ncbi:hypothetical protein [Brevundimonas bacteroides]|uniref:hypothetical protein n=1 Tax=Brevundimonas bacteroides TaxID=74311 RepID=UPI0012EE8E44|nr:hypothetical protein [Brevundimonas bacteroides]
MADIDGSHLYMMWAVRLGADELFGNQISSAVTAYVGFGRAAWPQSDLATLERRFGPAKAQKLVSEIEGLLAEAASLQPRLDLASSTRWVQAEMRRRHPKLSRKAADAIAWSWSYDNK